MSRITINSPVTTTATSTEPDPFTPSDFPLPDPLADLLLAMQMGRSCTQHDFDLIQRPLRVMAREALGRHAPYVPPTRENVEDVLGHLWRLVVVRGRTASRYDPTRSKVLTYLRYLLRDAAEAVGKESNVLLERDVYNSYVGDGLVQRLPLSLDASRPKDTRSDHEEMSGIAENIPATSDAIEQAVEEWHAEAVIALAYETAPDPIADVLNALYHDDLTLLAAAKRLGISRFVLYRRLKSWVADHEPWLVA